MVARSPAGSRAKGATYQRGIAHYFEEHGIRVLRRSGGEAGDDISLLDHPYISVELKNHDRRQMGTWWGQTVRQAAGRIPALIMKRYGVTSNGGQWVVMDLDSFIRLLEERGMSYVTNEQEEVLEDDSLRG